MQDLGLKVNINEFQVAGLTERRREFWHFRGRSMAACMASLTSSTLSEVLPSVPV